MNAQAGSQIGCQLVQVDTQGSGSSLPSCVSGSRSDTLRPENRGNNCGIAADLCTMGCLALRGMQPTDVRMANIFNDIVRCTSRS